MARLKTERIAKMTRKEPILTREEGMRIRIITTALEGSLGEEEVARLARKADLADPLIACLRRCQALSFRKESTWRLQIIQKVRSRLRSWCRHPYATLR